MKITILAVGKLKEDYLKEAFLYFKGLLSKYCTFELQEIPDERNTEGASPAVNESVKNAEGMLLLKKIKTHQYVIALAIEGNPLDTPELSRKLYKLQCADKNDIVFVIGGSLGLSKDILKRADYSLSFSPMTFPHQLMRIILMEQIYLALKDRP